MINIKGWNQSFEINKVDVAGRGHGHGVDRSKVIKEDYYVFEKHRSLRKQKSGSYGLGDYFVIVIEYDSFYLWKMFSDDEWDKIKEDLGIDN